MSIDRSRASSLVRRATSVAALVSAGLLLNSQSSPPLEHATGALPIDPAVYESLPKVGRHRAFLPSAVDLSADYPLPGSQGQQPDCTAWATTYAARSYLIGQSLGRRPTHAEAMSPAYVYNRLRPAGSSCTVGVRIMDALNLLKAEGTVSFADFPDDPKACATPAPATLRERAANFRIDDWRAIGHEPGPSGQRTPLVLDDIKGTLLRRVPIVFAMPVDKSFEDWKPANGPYTGAGNDTKNFHAMAAVGYDESRRAFRVINSWGDWWGDHGYIWISYDAFSRLVDEAYALETSTVAMRQRNESAPERFQNEMNSFQCGVVSSHREDGRLVVEGFGGLPQSLDRLKAAAAAYQPGMIWRVANHPWPQCEAETTLGASIRAGGISANVTDDTGRLLPGDPVVMHAGQRFGVRGTATAALPYLTMIYLQADGSAMKIYAGAPAAAADGRRTVTVGTSGARAMRYEVSDPLGDETIIALASAGPIFGPELDSYGTERQFLTALRSHLLDVPQGGVAATVIRVKTVQ